MIRSLGMSMALLVTFLLLGAGSTSARAGGALIPTSGSTAQISAVASAVNPTQILTMSLMYTGGDDKDHDGKNNGNFGNNNGDHDGNKFGRKGDHDPDDKAPIPEPSTILSFGAALLIGGGVLYSRRLRANKK